MESTFETKNIEVLMDTEQDFIHDYNEKVTQNRQRIPLVPRNKRNGWPLLQISLFTYDTKKQRYEPALGGGKCHDLKLTYYFLAALLRQTYFYDEKASDFTFHLLSAIVTKGKKFKVILQPPFALSVIAESGPMGYTEYNISLNNEKMRELNLLLQYFDRIAFKDDKIQIFDIQNKGYYYTEKEIQENINHEFCTFHNGQIYVDLEKMLTSNYRFIFYPEGPIKNFVVDHQNDSVENAKTTNEKTKLIETNTDTTDMFAMLFQVDKFKDVYQQHLKKEKEKPIPQPEIKVETVDPLKEIKSYFGNHENKLTTDQLSLQIIEKLKDEKSSFKKLKILDDFFLDVINKNEISYEYFRPSMSIFFNNKICNTQKADVKAIKLAYLMVIKKALLDESGEKLSAQEKKQIIDHARQDKSLIDYHTKFLFGFTNTRNSFDRLVTYAHRNGFLSTKKKEANKKEEKRV